MEEEPDYLALIRDCKTALGAILEAEKKVQTLPLDPWYQREVESMRNGLKGLMRRLYEIDTQARDARKAAAH